MSDSRSLARRTPRPPAAQPPRSPAASGARPGSSRRCARPGAALVLLLRGPRGLRRRRIAGVRVPDAWRSRPPTRASPSTPASSPRNSPWTASKPNLFLLDTGALEATLEALPPCDRRAGDGGAAGQGAASSVEERAAHPALGGRGQAPPPSTATAASSQQHRRRPPSPAPAADHRPAGRLPRCSTSGPPGYPRSTSTRRPASPR